MYRFKGYRIKSRKGYRLACTLGLRMAWYANELEAADLEEPPRQSS